LGLGRLLRRADFGEFYTQKLIPRELAEKLSARPEALPLDYRDRD
jgi:hypothetical protein